MRDCCAEVADGAGLVCSDGGCRTAGGLAGGSCEEEEDDDDEVVAVVVAGVEVFDVLEMLRA